MKGTTMKVLAASFVLSEVGIVSGVARAARDSTLADLAQYRQWRHVTATPMPVDLSRARLVSVSPFKPADVSLL